jgi:hypothetical protein
MSDPVERVAQWVIEARRAKYVAEHPFVDSPCLYDSHTNETCRAEFDKYPLELFIGGWFIPPPEMDV